MGGIIECQSLYRKPTFGTTDQELQDRFSSQGTVTSAKVMANRLTGRSQGFGFMEMSTQEEAEQADNARHGTDFGERILVVNAARPLEERRPFRSDPPNTPSAQ